MTRTDKRPVPQDGGHACIDGFKLSDNPFKGNLSRKIWSKQFKEQRDFDKEWNRE